MRIIAGTSGGIPIKVPRDTTRPTTDRVRESIFSSLGTSVIDADVLDLFAGSGSLGLESLSRGANSAVFIDESRAAAKIIGENLSKTRLDASAKVQTMRVDRFLRGLGSHTAFDLIFADPPYAHDEQKQSILQNLLLDEKLPEALRPDGVFVLETCSRIPLPDLGRWTSIREKIYGETRISHLTSHP